MITVGSDFSGVGAFNQALTRLGIEYKEIFACDMDKYARQTFIHNYGEPEYYPTNVYDREIPSKSIDIYMTSPPCQAFSLAGKRLGKDDKRGILFFNSHEFIQVNKPRYFIFENVKGLLSDDGGKTFSEWVNMLGGKSVNGVPIIFPYEDSVPYHLYWKVLNAKEHGIPQNRERVFLIGIRDDHDNNFRFPIEEHLNKRLKDVLEDDVADKYFLSETSITRILKSKFSQDFKDEDTDATGCLTAGYYKIPSDGNYIKIKSATSKGYEEATEGDSINFSVPNSETRRERVGKGVAQTLDTGCQQGVLIGDYRTDEGFRWRKDGNSPCIMASMRDTWKENFSRENPPVIMVSREVRTDESKKKRKETGTNDYRGKEIEFREQDVSNTITTSLTNDHILKIKAEFNDKRLNETLDKHELPEGKPMIIDTYNKSIHEECPTLKKHHAENGDRKLWDGYKIRRLTPRECFRLMDFPDSFTWPVSDSQAYKQAGNSIVVNVLCKILKNLNL